METYNRYQGNSGNVIRVPGRKASRPAEKQQAQALPPVPAASVGKRHGLPTVARGADPLSGLLARIRPGQMETEDLILLLILYLLYRESGDSEFLIMLGAMLLF